MATPMLAVGILDDCNERLSHKEVEQRRREKVCGVVGVCVCVSMCVCVREFVCVVTKKSVT